MMRPALGVADRISREQTVDASAAERLQRALFGRIAPEALARLAVDDPEGARTLVRRTLTSILPSQDVCADSSAAESLIDGVVGDTIGFGVIDGLMRDTSVTEVMVNGPYSIYFERAGRLHKSSLSFGSQEQLRNVIDRMISPVGRRVDERSPLVSARVCGGHRAHVALPPVAVDGPVLTVRKFTQEARTLRDLVQLGTVSPQLAMLLIWAVRARLNIAVSGGTGSGKTTLLNALAGEIDCGERIVTIEDSAELKFERHPHVVRLEARPIGADGSGAITIRDLVVASLRMRPDRIVVGEVRSSEALEMLQAMNTGHDGSLTTLHANSPREVPGRLAAMVGYGSAIGREQVLDQVASALDLIVHVARCRSGQRRVVELCEVGHRTSDGNLHLRKVAHHVQGAAASALELGRASGSWLIDESCSIPGRAVDAGVTTPQEVQRWREMDS